jgi:hypothetical protein
MDHIGIDVHKKESQICIVTEGGEVIERRVRAPLCGSTRGATMRLHPPRVLDGERVGGPVPGGLGP